MNQAQTPDSGSMSGAELKALLESLTGQAPPLPNNTALLDQVAAAISDGQSIGHSQFNELLLNVGYDRVEREFFLYLCDPSSVSKDANGSEAIASPRDMRKGIDTFRKLALLLYGNVKFGFKTLSRDSRTLLFFVQTRIARNRTGISVQDTIPSYRCNRSLQMKHICWAIYPLKKSPISCETHPTIRTF
jgi:hypothetical protein